MVKGKIEDPDWVKWVTVDWLKPTPQISKELGVSEEHVFFQRRKRAPETLRLMTLPSDKEALDDQLKWVSVNWLKTTTQISREFEVSLGAVSYQRKRRAPETLRPLIRDVEWDVVDWQRPPEEISRELGVPFETVLRRRREHTARSQKHLLWKSVDWANKTTNQIAEELKRSPVQVSRYRRIVAPETLGTLYRRRTQQFDWDAVNWRWKDAFIAKKLGCTRQAVNQQRQKRKKRKKLKLIQKQT